jgi:hypothetical protein
MVEIWDKVRKIEPIMWPIVAMWLCSGILLVCYFGKLFIILCKGINNYVRLMREEKSDEAIALTHFQPYEQYDVETQMAIRRYHWRIKNRLGTRD